MIQRMLAAALSLAALGAMSSPAGADGFSIAAGARAWFSTLDGDGRVDSTTAPGTQIDLEDTLGIDTDETLLVPYGHIGLGDHHFFGDYWTETYEGTKTLTGAVTYDGVTYAGGTTVTSDFELAVGSFVYHWELLSPDVGVSLGFGPAIGAKYVRFDGEVDAAAGGATASKSFAAPVPVLGGRLRLGLLDMLEVSALVTGIGGDYADVDASFLDGSVEATVSWMHVSAGVGYRAIRLDATANDGDTDETAVDIDIDGVYATAGLYF
jgi:hypothetical protein